MEHEHQLDGEKSLPTPKEWVITAAIMVAALLGAVFILLAAVSLFSPTLIADEDIRSMVRSAMLNAEQDMVGVPPAPNQTFTPPFPDNPYRNTSGVWIALCFNDDKTAYTMTGWVVKGEYWNHSSETPGSISGPETSPACSLTQ